MYFRILKKDLKRKKTMNCIILLFVILSSMFLASGVNNIYSIATGLDRYLDMAGLGDYLVLAGEPDRSSPFEENLKKADSVTGWRKERIITVTSDHININGRVMKGFSSSGLMLSPDKEVFRYYDIHNDLIEHIEEGKVYVTNSTAKRAGLETGDKLEFDIGGKTLEFEFAGVCKDAALGSDMLDLPRFLINKDIFEDMLADDDIVMYAHAAYYIDTADENEVSDIISKTEGVRFSATRSMIATSYIVNMLIAGVIMAVSLCLMIIAFAVLRFTISFSIDEEFREIGVMKAVGLKNRSIRALYLVKYFGLAVIGALTGCAAAFPFGNMLLESVSENMIISNDYMIPINLACCIAVIAIIILFCLGCTSRINKLSPVDAVRSGQTGERYRKHGAISLNRSRLGADSFLSLNDLLSSPRQSIMITAMFTLCALLVMILSDTAATLQSDKLLYLINVTASDVYLVNNNRFENDIIAGRKTIADANEEIRRELADNGMPAEVHNECMYSAYITFGESSSSAKIMRCSDTRTDEYSYSEGSAPQYSDEIAITALVADEIGAQIGDTIDVTVSGRTDRFIVTGLLDSLNGLGKSGRFHQSYDIPDTAISNYMAFQIDFEDHPDKDVTDGRIEKIKQLYGTNSVFDRAGYVNDCTKAADAVTNVKKLTFILALIIIILITVLIERSFISKEKSQIALMKAMGFRGRSVVHVHILRFAIISAASVVCAAVLSIPATKLVMDPIFAMMGASYGIHYEVDAFETFLMLPAAMIAAVSAAAFFTSLCTQGIKASDTADIE